MPRTPCRVTLLLAVIITLPLLYSCGKAEDTSLSSSSTSQIDTQRTGVYDTQGPRSLQGLAWKFKAEGEIASTPAIAGGIVYFGSYDEHIYAVDAATTQVRWKLKTGDSVHSSPVVQGGVVYAGSEDGALYAVDAGSGAEKWKSRTYGYFILLDRKGVCCEEYLNTNLPAPGTGYNQRILHGYSGFGVSASPVITGGMVYFGGEDEHFYAAGVATGMATWISKAPSGITSSAAAGGGAIYFVNDEGTLFSLSAQSGRENWRFHTLNTFLSSSVTVANGVVYLAGGGAYAWAGEAISSALWAIDAATGREIWRFRVKDAGVTAPIVFENRVYFAAGNNLYAIDALTGRKIWGFDTGRYVSASPSLADGIVYVGNGEGYLYAIDASTGREEWRFKADDEITSAPAIANGMVYFGCKDGYLYALK
jgi:outer membrane protein assembly factor BamB